MYLDCFCLYPIEPNRLMGRFSKNYIRTYNTITYPTFMDAAIAWGLLEDDKEWVECLSQASKYKMPAQLRQLFVNINVCHIVKEPLYLFVRFFPDLSQDFVHQGLVGQENENLLEHLTLFTLKTLFAGHERSLDEFKLSEPDLNLIEMAQAIIREHQGLDHNRNFTENELCTPKEHAVSSTLARSLFMKVSLPILRNKTTSALDNTLSMVPADVEKHLYFE